MKDKRSLILLVLVTLVYLIGMAPIFIPVMPDFHSFYFAGVGLGEHGNIYDFQFLTELAARSGLHEQIFPYLYPPALAFYIAPLCRLPESQAAVIWLLGTVILGAWITADGARFAFALRGPDEVGTRYLLQLLSLLVFGVLPFHNNLVLGQVNIIVLACIGASLAQSFVYRRDLLAGILLAPAILIKITPLCLLLYFAMNRRYKTLYGCALGLIILGAPTLASREGLVAWQHFLDFTGVMGYGKTLPGLPSPAGLPNFSVAASIARLGARESTIDWATVAILAALGCVVLIQHYRLSRKGAGETLLLPYLALMVVGSPLTYLHHVIYVYPGVLLCCWIALLHSGRLRAPLLVLLIGLTFCANIDFPFLYGRFGAIPAAFKSVNLYALLGLFALGLVIPDLGSLAKEPRTQT